MFNYICILNAMPVNRCIAGHELRFYLNAGKWWWQRWSALGLYCALRSLAKDELVTRRIIRIKVCGIWLNEYRFRVTAKGLAMVKSFTGWGVIR
jgi:hypothetical protein